jgi:hypothetical protein
LEILKTGDFVGTVSLFTADRRSASVRALTDVTLDAYQDLDPQRFLAGVPSWVLGVFKDVTTRLKRMDQALTQSRQTEKSLQRKLPNRFVYAGMICRLLKLTIEARSGGDILQVDFPIHEFSEKAAVVLRIPSELVSPIFREIIQSRYLNAQTNDNGVLGLSSPDLSHLDLLADYFEEKSQFRMEGLLHLSRSTPFKALLAIGKRSDRILKPISTIEKEVEKEIGVTLAPDWAERLFRFGAMSNATIAGNVLVEVNLDRLDRNLDLEEVGEAIQKLRLINPDPFFAV